MGHVDVVALNRDQAATARIEAQDELVYGAARVGRFVLGNGLRVLIWEDRRAPVFSYQTWFSVGSRVEVAGKSGIAHLFEHLMFKATKNLEEGEFDAIMERRGAETNAATWVDWTYYKEKLPSGADNLELCCKLEADRMEHMILNSDQLESEREVVVNERLLRVDNDPDGQLYEALYRLAYEAHPYGVPTIGWMEDIRAISLEDCLSFYERYYAPNSAAIVIVGDVDTTEALRLVQRYYGHLAAAELPEEALPVEPRQAGEKRQSFELPISSEKGLYAWHAMAGTDPDQAALEVLDEVLTGGESARLYERLVTETELASSVGAWRWRGGTRRCTSWGSRCGRGGRWRRPRRSWRRSWRGCATRGRASASWRRRRTGWRRRFCGRSRARAAGRGGSGTRRSRSGTRRCSSGRCRGWRR
jgi:zinc protease